MEYYESSCQKCGHRWQWVGYKTGIGKTPEQLAEMAVAGKKCPECGGEAAVGLDYTSPAAQELTGFLGRLFGSPQKKP